MTQVIYLLLCQRKKHPTGRDGIVGGGERKRSNKKDNLSFPAPISSVTEIKIFIQPLKWSFSALLTVFLLNPLKPSPGDNYTEFKGLSPEDAKTKLAQLIKDEVDLNKDGVLTEDEIRQRFHVTTKEYRKKEVMETMKQHDEGQYMLVYFSSYNILAGHSSHWSLVR